MPLERVQWVELAKEALAAEGGYTTPLKKSLTEETSQGTSPPPFSDLSFPVGAKVVLTSVADGEGSLSAGGCLRAIFEEI